MAINISGRALLIVLAITAGLVLFLVYYHGPRVTYGDWGSIGDVKIKIVSVDYARPSYASSYKAIHLAIINNGTENLKLHSSQFWLNSPIALGASSVKPDIVPPKSSCNVTINVSAPIWGGATLTFRPNHPDGPSIDLAL